MKVIKLVLFSFIIIFASCKKRVIVEDISGFRMVSINDSKNKDEHLILDVRSNEDYKKGHLEYALNIPMDELKARVKEIEDLKHLPVYIYGNNADESFASAKILVENNFENIFNAEGTDEYLYPFVHFNTIRVYELRNNPALNDYFLIDYRTRTSYQAEHFKASVNISIGEISTNLNLLPKNKNKHIIMYCNTGITSTWGAKELIELGYKNVSVILEGAISETFIKEMDLDNESKN